MFEGPDVLRTNCGGFIIGYGSGVDENSLAAEGKKGHEAQEMDKVPTAESELVVWLAERVIDEVVLTIQVEEHP